MRIFNRQILCFLEKIYLTAKYIVRNRVRRYVASHCVERHLGKWVSGWLSLRESLAVPAELRA